MTNRIYAFDVLKFVGSIGIALLHFNWRLIPQGYLFVELFFIISGFLLYKNKVNYIEKDIKSILAKRLRSFYLLYLFVIIGQIFLNNFPSFADFFSSLFMLGDIGLGKRFNYGALWFLGVYVYCFIFYVLIFKTFQVKQALFIIGIIMIVTLCSMYTFSPGHALNRTYEVTIGPFQFGLLRGIAGIGIGILCASVSSAEQEISILQLYISVFLVGLLVFYLFHQATPSYDYINYIVICGLLQSLIIKNNKLSEFLNYLGQKFQYICSLSLPIYIFHCMVIVILKKLNYSTQDYPPLIYLLWVVLFAIVMERLQKCIIVIYRKCKPA